MMVYGYIRVSTDKQDTENQKIGIEEKATQLGLTIDKWISDDGVSGAKEPDKRLLGNLLNTIQKGDTIIVSELSRLGRKLFMIMRILEGLMEKEAKLYSVKDGYNLDNSITSKVLAFAFGLAAEIERDMIQKRTKEGLARRRAQGVILGRPVGSISGSTALKGKEDLVKAYLDEGLGYTAIGRILGVHRATVQKVANDNGWTSQTSFIGGVPKMNETKAFEVFNEALQDELKSLLNVEHSASAIAEHFQKHHCIEISPSMMIKYINDLGFYPKWKKINDEKRAKYNVDCGQNRR